MRRAAAALFEGKRVVVEGSFREESLRTRFLELAVECSVPGWLLVRTAPAEAVKERLALRQDSVSDADWRIYREAARRWEPYGEDTKPRVREIPAYDNKEQAWETARLLFETEGLL